MFTRLASFSTPWGQARLKRRQGEHYDQTVAQYRRQFNFFVSKYEASFWWYELSEMMRKLLLTSVAAFLDATRAPYSELVCKITISFTFLLLFVKCSPKSDSLLDIVMATAQLCTFLTLFYALLLKIDFFDAEGISPEVTGAVLVSIQVLPILVSVGCCLYAFSLEHGITWRSVVQRISSAVSRLSKAKPDTGHAARNANAETTFNSSVLNI